MVAPAGLNHSRGQLIPLPARRYVLRVRVDDTEYVYDATARLPQAQASMLSALRGDSDPTSAPMLAMQGALRTGIRLALPMLCKLVASLRRHPAFAALLPELPRLPRHTDALEHITAWVVEAIFTALGTGTYVLEPDEEGAYLDTAHDLAVLPIRRLHWWPTTMDDALAPQDDRQAVEEVQDA